MEAVIKDFETLKIKLDQAIRVSELELELEELNVAVSQVNGNYEYVVNELIEGEEELESHKERVETSDARIKELEVELTHVGNSLKSMELNEGDGNDNRSKSGDQITVEAKYEEKKAKAIKDEAKAKEMETRTDELEQKLQKVKSRYDEVKQEYDGMMV